MDVGFINRRVEKSIHNNPTEVFRKLRWETPATKSDFEQQRNHV
ncbi:hypothetical protein B4077_3578 [Bacillus cereus]|uniref:Uncharacterized protein n=1 Tax=Bacillus cereus TaxID=1396 RepID=A0A0G8F190_BACCE|nr:hypothetical protein B4077_3578 [Bacillus cereus]